MPLSFSPAPTLPILPFNFTVTHIKPDPYTFVPSILNNVTIPSNLISVRPTDADQEDEDVIFYFYLIAMIIIMVVITSFCLGSSTNHKKTYSSLPDRIGPIETLHIEEDNTLE
jgi:hypothetical protein